MRRGAPAGRIVAVLGVLAATFAAPGARAETDLGADIRLYVFGVLEDTEAARRDAEVALIRAKLETELASELDLEAHALFALNSPPEIAGNASILSGSTRRLFDLSTSTRHGDVLAVAEIDRLNLRWAHPDFDVVAGRQAVTWGVNYFWPVLDLFAPFAPQQIDRDYKAGVDAARLTIPAGSFSQVEIIGAAQGDTVDDLSLASLGRLHSGTTDYGFMAGRFHGDTVLGTFLSADAKGTGVRLEIAHTDSGDPMDAILDRDRFVRASLGIDRLLTPNFTLVGEISYNGFGAADPADYLLIAQADRVRRGEVTSLGRVYGGLSLGWQAHPLWSLSQAVLYNHTDGSFLAQSFADGSLSTGVSIQFGTSIGFGDEISDGGGSPTEYGAVPLNAWFAVKAYF